MVFFMEILNIWQKSNYFFLESFKSIGWHGFSYGFLVVLDMFHQLFWICFINVFQKLFLILNFTNAALSQTTFRSIFVS